MSTATKSPWGVTATSGGAKSEVPPAGSHPAVLVAIVDLGTHRETFKDEKNGERTADLRKVLFAWELTSEPMSGMKDSNHIMTRDYNVTFSNKSSLRKMVEGWRGKAFAEGEGFDVGVLLGKACLLTVTHAESARGNTYAKIGGIAPLPKVMTAPPPKRKLTTWMESGSDETELSWLPFLYGEPVADVVKRCLERTQSKQPSAVPPDPMQEAAQASDQDEEVPF